MENKQITTDFYSIKEFALKLGVHHNTIRNAIKNGRINALRIGGGRNSVYRIPHSEIDRIALFDLKDMINRMVEEKLKERK